MFKMFALMKQLLYIQQYTSAITSAITSTLLLNAR